MVQGLLQDLKHSARMLRKNPAFACVAIASIAIGVGANAAVFSMADAFVLRPLPVPRPGEVMTVSAVPPVQGLRNPMMSYRDYLDVREGTRSFDRLATAFAVFDANKRLAHFNHAYVDLWELDPEWLATRPRDGEILDRLRQARKLPEKADYRAWKRTWLGAYDSNTQTEDQWHLPDGQTLHVIADSEGRAGVTYLYENVTERLQVPTSSSMSMMWFVGVRRRNVNTPLPPRQSYPRGENAATSAGFNGPLAPRAAAIASSAGGRS